MASEYACCTDEGAESCLKRGSTPTRPQELPFEPIKENIPKFEHYFRTRFKNSAFNTCTHQPLQGMTGVPMKTVRRRDDACPPVAYTPIPVPFYWKKQVKPTSTEMFA